MMGVIIYANTCFFTCFLMVLVSVEWYPSFEAKLMLLNSHLKYVQKNSSGKGRRKTRTRPPTATGSATQMAAMMHEEAG